MNKFFAELVAGYIFEKGLDSLIAYVRGHYPASPNLTDNDKAVLQHFRSSVPNTYQRVGVLFEVYVIERRDGTSETILVPRSFGENPTGAIINEAMFNTKDLPALPADVQREWVERRSRFTQALEAGEVEVDRTAIWWELDRTSREWTTRPANVALAEEQAKRSIDNHESLVNLSRAATEINALRANAAVWLNLREQAETRIRDQETRSKVQALVDANDRMVHEIDSALQDLKRAQEYQGFISTLNLFASLLKVGAEFSKSYDATGERMVALENYSITVIEKAGNEMRRLDVELKNILGGYVTRQDVMPSFDIRTIERITKP